MKDVNDPGHSDKRGPFKSEVYAKAIIKDHGPFKSIGKDRRWKFNDRIWVPTDFDRLGPVVARRLPEEHSNVKYIDNVLRMMHHLTQVDPDEEKPLQAIRLDSMGNIRINVQNGIVEINVYTKKIRLLNHSKAEFVTSELPIEYDPEAKCRTFYQILHSCLPDEADRQLLQCFVGYCFQPDFKFHTALFCKGNPDSGKSLLILHGIGSMFGRLQCHVTTHDICMKRDSIRDLTTHLINISTEIKTSQLDDSSVFKNLISGEPITADLKYDKSATLRWLSKNIFLGNDFPYWSKGSDAERKRLRFIYFPNKFSKNDKLRIAIATEAAGIFNWALRGLVEAIDLDDLPEASQESIRCANQFNETNNPVGVLNGLYCKYEGRMIAEEYSEVYKAFCKSRAIKLNSDIQIQPLRVLKKENLRIESIIRTVNLRGVTVSKQIFKGISFKPVVKQLVLDGWLSKKPHCFFEEKFTQEY